MWKEFTAFVSRGNVIDLAVAVVIGAAFGKIVSAFVDVILMPPLGMLVGGVDFSSLFYVLDSSKGIPLSLAEAKVKGIPVVAYGNFINEIISFLIIAFAIFLFIKTMQRVKPAVPTPVTKNCPYCASSVSVVATRCPYCTSPLA